MVIYLDVLLFENLIVDMFLLYITSQTVRVKVKAKLLIAAASIGSAYVVTLLFPSLKPMTGLPFQILAALIMIITVFRKKNILFILKCTGLFILYSMLLSGICVFILYKQSTGLGLINVAEDFSYRWLIIAIMILYMVVNRFVIFIRERRDVTVYTYDVEIITKEGKKVVRAFLDTGNELREPVTNLPVMVVQRKELDGFILRNEEKLYIPYKVVGGTNGRMEGFRPVGVKIFYDKEKWEFRDVIIGFCDDQLSELDDYSALLSRGII